MKSNTTTVVIGAGPYGLSIAAHLQASIDKLSFIDPSLRDQILQQDDYPLQKAWFESCNPHLYCAGAIAGFTFGPICRFVTGSNAAAHQTSRHIVRTTSSVHMPVAI